MKIKLRSKIFALTKMFICIAWLQCIFITTALAHIGIAQNVQNTLIQIHWENDNLEKVFRDVQNVTNFTFTYDSNQIKDIVVSGKGKDLPLIELLKYISHQTGLKFSISEEFILVEYEHEKDKQLIEKITIPKLEKLKEISMSVIHHVEIHPSNNDFTVKGKVIDSSGEPLIGATIQLKDSNNGTITNIDGEFELSIDSQSGQKLIVSYLGYQTREITISESNFYEIILQDELTTLDEIVVVGYGTSKKENLTGAVDQITADVLEKRPVSTLGQSMQGVIPNLNITFGSGQPGSSPQFNIRGLTSINGGNPLIIVDGVPMDPQLVALLNPTEIESVSVLKDAASSAIYGARGAFGVIIIKTKSGKEGKPVFQYSGFTGVNRPTIQPQAVTDPYISMSTFHNARKAWDGANTFTQEQLDYAQQRSQDPSLPSILVDNQGRSEYYGSVDWFDETYQENQPISQHTLSVSGGGKNIGYFFSGNYLSQDGIYEYDADNYSKYNLRARFDLDLNDWITITNNTIYNSGRYNYKTFYGGPVTLQRYVVLLGNAQNTLTNQDGSWTFPAGLSVGFLRDGGPGSNRQTLLQNKISAVLNPFGNNFKAHIEYAYQLDGGRIEEHYKQIPYFRNDRTPGVKSLRGINRYFLNDMENSYQVLNVFGTYEKKIEKHDVSATVGFNQELRKISFFSASRDGLISNQGALNLASGEMDVNGGSQSLALRGVFFRLKYNYDERYLIEINGRYDGTSRFPKDDRFGFFPSASAAWRISQEPFFKDHLNTVSNLKLRASYGSLGNQEVASFYPYIASMNPYQSPRVINGELPLAINAPGLVSSELTWEKVNTLDFGIDITLFDKLDFTADWYRRNTIGMLTKGRTLPAVLGTDEPRINAADLQTDGIELSIKWNDATTLLGKSFRYNIGLIYGDNKSIITKFDNPNNFLGDYYVGQDIGEIWGYETLGFFQSQEEISSSADHSLVMRKPEDIAPGDLKFADLNNDGVINIGEYTLENPGDLKVIGNSQIRHTYGISGGFDWDGISFSFFFQGVGQHDFMPGPDDAYMWSVFNRPNNTVLEHIVDNYWTPENRDAYFPRLYAYSSLAAGKQLGAAQSRYLQDASYLRLKNMSIGYNLPSSMTKPVGLERVYIYISGENIWEHTNMIMPVDPELVNLSGESWGDGQNYPFQRTFSIGLNTTF